MNHALPTRSLIASVVVASLAVLLIGCSDGPGQPPDTEPSFGTQRIQDQAFTVGTAITPLVLPAATGGNAPLAYSLTPSVPGIRFDPATRTVTGTPTATGDHAMTYRVTDDDGDAASLTFSIRITAPAQADTEPSFGTQRIQDQAFTVGTAITPLVLPAATGGNAPLTYSLTPNVPGIRFDPATRTVTGTPTATGDHAMTYRVTDDDDDADSLSFTITIAAHSRPEVHILSKSLLESDVLTVADDSLSFSQPVSYRQGDFIAGEISAKTPYGLLRKVISVSDDSKSVMTADATLEEAIERGTVRISGTLTPDDLTPASRAALAGAGLLAMQDGGVLIPATTGEVRFGHELSATDGRSTLSGRIDFVLGYELIADYDRGLKDARFSVTPRQVVTVRLSTAGAFRETWQIVPTLRFSPIPVPVAPFPIFFTPELDLQAGVGGGLVASVSATHTESVTVGVECDDECGDPESWSSIYESHQTAASGVSFDTDAAGTVGVFVAPKMTFNLYGRLGGPYVSAISSVDANAALTNAGADERCLHLSLQAALRGEVGGEARVSVFGRTLFSARLDEFAFDIVDPVLLWEEQGPCEEEPSFGAERVQDHAFTVGTAITALVLPAASGGDAPLTYSLRPNVPGLQFNAATRTLSGSPTTSGVYKMTYTVTDADGDAAELMFIVEVARDAVPAFDTTVSAQTYAVNTAIAPLVLPAASGGDPPLTYSLRPDIPGLQFNASTRTLSGTPTLAAAGGVYSMTYRVVDSDGDEATLTFTVRVTHADPPTEPHLFNPPEWIHGTWGICYLRGTDEEDVSWTFSAHNVIHHTSPIDFATIAAVATISEEGGDNWYGIVIDYPIDHPLSVVRHRFTKNRSRLDYGTAEGESVFLLCRTDDILVDFGTQTVSDHTFFVGTTINVPLVLPEAVGGNPPLSYTLTPEVPGLWFNPTTRIVGGTPSKEGNYDMTYRVEDSDGDAAYLHFTLRVDEIYAISIGVIAYQHYWQFDESRKRPEETTSCRARYIVSDTLVRNYTTSDFLFGNAVSEIVELEQQLEDRLRAQCEQRDDEVTCRTLTVNNYNGSHYSFRFRYWFDSLDYPHGIIAEGSEYHYPTDLNELCPYGVGLADTAEIARERALYSCSTYIYGEPGSRVEPFVPNSCSPVIAMFVPRP